jgi:hypothetical protein
VFLSAIVGLTLGGLFFYITLLTLFSSMPEVNRDKPDVAERGGGNVIPVCFSCKMSSVSCSCDDLHYNEDCTF